MTPPLPDTAQSAAWRLAAGSHLVGDNLNLHQVLQAVIWLIQFTTCFSPRRLGRLDRPERNRNLHNTDMFKQNTAKCRYKYKVQVLGPVSESRFNKL